jgi:hypothetical protein
MTPLKESDRTLGSYLRSMLRSPIATWWGAATTLIEIASFVLIRDSVTFNKLCLLLIIFAVSFSLFVGFSVLVRGWFLYKEMRRDIHISKIVRIENEQVFILDGCQGLTAGSVFEVYRVSESVEVPIGFIEAVHQRDDGLMQAKPIWIMPGHLRDIETHQVSTASLRVHAHLTRRTLGPWIDDQAEKKLEDLMRRGRK